MKAWLWWALGAAWLTASVVWTLALCLAARRQPSRLARWLKVQGALNGPPRRDGRMHDGP